MPIPDLWRQTVRTLLPDAAGVPDADLLARFRDSRDEAAFELLLYRHGPMVWAACCRLASDSHAAEDAFQATFLALARRAGSIRRAQSVPAWLHRVAVRAGLHQRRGRPPAGPLGFDPVDPAAGPAGRAAAADLARQLDATVDRLPERLRRVFVACELQGSPLADVAARLRCPVGTVASRLARARERVRALLSARGVTVGLTGGLGVVELVPPQVRAAAVRVGCGGAGIRPGVAALARRAGRPALGGAAAGMAATLAAGLVAVAVALGVPDDRPPNPKPPAKAPPPAVAVRTDAEGVPLPDGALARLGSSRFRHDGQPMESVAFSADGRLLASTHGRGVSVFEVATGRALHRFRVPDDQYAQVARFLDDGKHLAVGSSSPRAAELAVYALADGKRTATTTFDSTANGNGNIRVIDVTADGSRALVQDLWGRGVFLRDLKAGKDLWLFEVSEVVSTRPFTADGKSLAVAMTRKVELRDAATGKMTAVFPDPGPGFGDLYSAILAHDGRVVATSKGIDALAVLDAKGPVPVRTFRTDPGLNRGLISPNGRYLFGLGQMVTPVWDLAAKDDRGPVARLPGAMAGGFSPDGKTLALDDHGFVTLWTMGDWKALPQSADPPSLVYPVRFALGGRRVLGHTRAGWVSWPAAGGPLTAPAADTDVHLGARADVSADGRVAVEAVYVRGETPEKGKSFFQVTDLATGAVRRVPRDGSSWKPPRLSPDGRFVSADIRYQDLAVWDLATGALLHRQPGSPKDIHLAAAPAADGKGLALSVSATRRDNDGHPDGPQYAAVTVTDHRTGRTWDLDPVPATVSHAHFSPDGSRLVVQTRTGGVPGHGDVSVWDVRTGRRLMSWPRPAGITGLRDSVPDLVALSADQRALLVGDAAGQLTLIEIATGKERASFRHASGVLSAAFHPDGSKAVSSSLGGPVYVWDLLGEPGRWDAAKADAVWADLASPEAKTAYAAVRKLRANPTEAVALLRDRMKLPAVPTGDALAGWLKALDAPTFADRERAQRDLTAVADLVRPQIEAARKGEKSAEAAQRLDQVLKSLGDLTPERVRSVRACEVLEGIRSPEAGRVLRAWAGGPAGARLTAEAKESLGRLLP